MAYDGTLTPAHLHDPTMSANNTMSAGLSLSLKVKGNEYLLYIALAACTTQKRLKSSEAAAA